METPGLTPGPTVLRIDGVAGKVALSESVKRLLARELHEALAGLERSHRRTLSDNPQGSALVEEALRQALLIGVREQCQIDWRGELDLETSPQAWDDWQEIREETPEGREWPAVLADTRPAAVRRAGDVLDAAATELDVRRREREDFRWVGEQCAEAGAALVRSLTQPPERERDTVWAEPAPIGPVESDGTVRVARAEPGRSRASPGNAPERRDSEHHARHRHRGLLGPGGWTPRDLCAGCRRRQGSRGPRHLNPEVAARLCAGRGRAGPRG